MKNLTATGVLLLLMASAPATAQNWSGPKQIWHPLTLTLDGPESEESGTPNPFLDYRLVVELKKGRRTVRVPGFFAADGNAAESSATQGSKWQVHWMPDAIGEWQYTVSFRSGKGIALDESHNAGKALRPNGIKGTITIAPAKKPSPFAKGRLRYVGKRYLQWTGDKAYFLKGGADSPENLLGYVDFDDTRAIPRKNRKGKLHRFQPHVRDWKKGDPTWKGGKGKGLIGALNYLAGKGMSSIYFLTMNVTGDGNDVWPWTRPNIRDRFDCSKLAQWNLVFDHMDRLGISLHVVTQETENDQLLDGGRLGPQRKLYYKELIARFAHHRSVVWNLGEECTNTTAQIKAFSDFFKRHDPYQNPVVVHTYPNNKEQVYAPLLGHKTLDGPSLQFSDDWHRIPRVVEEWVDRSEKSGHPWVVNVDEPGTAKFGLDHDAKPNSNQPLARKTALWGALLAGGAGVEWYFGYANPHNDLNLEDFRSRDRVWDQTRYALDFFHRYLPFSEMRARNDLVQGKGAQCFANPGQVYCVYLPRGGQAVLDVGKAKNLKVEWFNPRKGGSLIEGAATKPAGNGKISLGDPPAEKDQDWVVLIRKP